MRAIYGHSFQLNQLGHARQSQRLPHALLFAGLAGIGKKKVAFALAQSLLCEKNDEANLPAKQGLPAQQGLSTKQGLPAQQGPPAKALPQKADPECPFGPVSACGKCRACRAVQKKQSPHIMFIQPEGLNIKVSAIREIDQFLALQSLAPARIVIIDSAHQMNLSAANSFLKILEEPPAKVYFILVSSQISAIPITVRSRTQIQRFAPLLPKDLKMIIQQKKHHQQKTKIQSWMITGANGSLENLARWSEHKELRTKAFELLRHIDPNTLPPTLDVLSSLVKDREQALFACLCWQGILRDSYLSQWSKTGLTNIIHQDQKDLLVFLTKLPPATLAGFYEQIINIEQDLKSYADPVLAFDHFILNARSTCLTGA